MLEVSHDGWRCRVCRHLCYFSVVRCGCASDYHLCPEHGMHVHTEDELESRPASYIHLDEDPAESKPVDPATIPEVMAAVNASIAAFKASCSATLHSKTDYSSNPKDRPCGNHSSACCRTRAH